MSKLSLPALGCLSLLALGLTIATPAFAEDEAPTDETTVDEGFDPSVDPAVSGPAEGEGVTEADPEVTYDPEIAQTGVGGPEVQRGGGDKVGAVGTTGRTDSGRTGTGVITGKIIIKIAD